MLLPNQKFLVGKLHRKHSIIPQAPPLHIRIVPLSLGWHIQGEAVIKFGSRNFSFPLKSGINGAYMLFYGHGVKSNSDLSMNENYLFIGT